MLVGMARCAVTARVQRAERIVKDVRITAHVAPLDAPSDGSARRTASVIVRSLGMLEHLLEKFAQAGSPESIIGGRKLIGPQRLAVEIPVLNVVPGQP
jgi:hypothetical protein